MNTITINDSSKIIKKDKVIENELLIKSLKKRNYSSVLAVIIIITQFGLSYFGMIKSEAPISFFSNLNISALEFSRQTFITGIFMYLLLGGLFSIGFKPNMLKASIMIITISCSIALLIATDKAIQTPTNLKAPNNLYNFIYFFTTQHNALILLFVLMTFFIGVSVYYLIRHVFVVQFSSTGIHLKLPGQTLYYLPIFPQISWQNTKINIEKGKKYWIELSGYVSPGASQNIHLLNKYKEKVNREINEGKNSKLGDYLNKLIWPYSGPEGYSTKLYLTEDMIDVIKEDILYRQENYYIKDPELTVRGLTHNKVIGFIKGDDDPDDEPHSANARKSIIGYDWNDPRDKENLICLSRDKYPFLLEAKKTGQLYVVINDVDRARWDNAGMFFLKITKSSF